MDNLGLYCDKLQNARIRKNVWDEEGGWWNDGLHMPERIFSSRIVKTVWKRSIKKVIYWVNRDFGGDWKKEASMSGKENSTS